MRRSSSARYAGTSIVPRSSNVFHPITPTFAPASMPSSARISESVRERSRGWLGRLKSWNRCRRIGRGAAPATPKHSLPTRTAGSPDGPTTSMASSNRGSNPVTYARFALCSRSA